MIKHTFVLSCCCSFTFALGWWLRPDASSDQHLEDEAMFETSPPLQIEERPRFSLELPKESRIDSHHNQKLSMAFKSPEQQASSQFNTSENIKQAPPEQKKSPTNPLDSVKDFLARKDHLGAMEFLNIHQPDIEPKWIEKILDLERKTKQPFLHQLENWTTWAKDHLTKHPQSLKLILSIMLSNASAGRIETALEFHFYFASQLSSAQNRQVTQKAREQFLSQHLNQLSQGEQWEEITAVLSSKFSPQGDDRLQFLRWDARASIELLDWARAETLIDLIASDPNLQQSANDLRQMLQERRTTFEKDTSLEENDDWTTLPIVMHGHHAVVQIEVEGRTYSLLLDTGASLVVLDHAAYRQLEPFFSDFPSIKSYHTAGGWVDMPTGTVPSLQLGSFKISDVQIAFSKDFSSQSQFSGLLGMNILRYFRFDIDTVQQELRLKLK